MTSEGNRPPRFTDAYNLNAAELVAGLSAN